MPVAVYLIKNRMTSLVLTAEQNGLIPHACVTPQAITRQEGQMFYDDNVTGTIRSFSRGLCFDIGDDGLKVAPYQPGNRNQLWIRCPPYIRNRFEPNHAIDINHDAFSRVRVSVFEFTRGDSQCWIFETVGHLYNSADIAKMIAPRAPNPRQVGIPWPRNRAVAPPVRQPPPAAVAMAPVRQPPPAMAMAPVRQGLPVSPTCTRADTDHIPPKPYVYQFYIKSELNQQVLTVPEEDAKPGTPVFLSDKHEHSSNRQLWTVDKEGYLHSVLNDFVFHIQDRCQAVSMMPPSQNPRNLWKVYFSKIVNQLDEFLQVDKETEDEYIVVHNNAYYDNKSQHWSTDHIKL